MPLYEYQCSSCNKVHEIIQKFSDPVIENCPQCEGPVQKLMSMNSFALKGSGWYTTDYKRSGSSSSSSSASSSAPSDSTSPAACGTATSCGTRACEA